MEDEECVACVCNSSMYAMEGKEIMWLDGRESYNLKCHLFSSMEPLEVF